MSNDLLTQLAEYGRQQRAERPQHERRDHQPHHRDQFAAEALLPAPLRLVPVNETESRRRTFSSAVAAIAGAAAVLLVTIGGVSLLIGSHTETQSTANLAPPAVGPAIDDTAIARTAEGVAVPASSVLLQRIGVVEAMASAANDARLADYMALFEPEAMVFGSHHDERSQQALMAAGLKWAFPGDARSSCVAGDGGDVTCYAVTQQDRFHGGAGISIRADFSFTFDAQNRITSIEVDRSDRSRLSAPFGQQGLSQQSAFTSRFLRWLAETHPQVANSMSPPTASGLPAAADIPLVLDYVVEFVAQSDLYPQQSTGIPNPPAP